MTPSKIVLVEDDPDDAALITDALIPDGYDCQLAKDCGDGWRKIEGSHPDLVILDVNLPDGSGLGLCRKIRSHPSLGPTPVILLTGKGLIQDKTSGFEAGADHYLVKPFQIQELRLWVHALLRRVSYVDKEGGVLRAEDFVIDPQSHRVTAAGAVIANLTRKEFDLLYELVRRRPKVLSKEFILSSLWNKVLRDNTVEVHIKNIRMKLGSAASRIVTVPGAGYRFE